MTPRRDDLFSRVHTVLLYCFFATLSTGLPGFFFKKSRKTIAISGPGDLFEPLQIRTRIERSERVRVGAEGEMHADFLAETPEAF